MTLQHLDILIGFATVMLGASLLITVLTQLISALLGLRGSNLRWGIRTLLTTADSGLKTEGKNIANEILNHPLISDSTFSKFAGWPGFQWLVTRFKLASAIRKEELINVLDKLHATADTKTATALKNNLAGVKSHIETWFDSTMERVAQRFTMSTRMWTVLFAFVLALGFHLDSLALLQKLSRDQALRARLVAGADAILRETSQVLGAAGETNAFVVSIQQLKKREPEAGRLLTNTPPSLVSFEAANFWVRTQLGDRPEAQKILATYQQLASSNVVARAPELMGSVAVVHDELARAGIELLPDFTPFPWRDYCPIHAAFWGMVISAALLSLGAPFWFNALKTLTSLRPVPAKKIQKQEEGPPPK